MRYLIVVLLLLGGCTKKWTHAEYTPERFQADSAACEAHALEMTNKGSQRKDRELYTTCLRNKGWEQTVVPR